RDDVSAVGADSKVVHWLGVSLKDRPATPGAGFPYSRGAIIAGSHQYRSVVAEVHFRQSARMPAQRGFRLPRIRTPDASHAIEACSHEIFSIRAERCLP